ncbi:tRNA lysidine(34) synthetase TilS [Candidatus Gracilibacteria bacterium]|nr:tRNA lysidine(34) synthetase TilS [Candidatus Gracilibacteria bacterium]
MELDLENFLNKYYKKDEKIILACSTGPDSMFLLYELLKTSYKENIVACYFNHKLRIESDEEELFLEDLGKKLGFQVEIGVGDINKIKTLYPSISIEELARQKRYQFFKAICEIHSSNKIITAHHLDDKIETFFFNLLRGSKLSGLINMKKDSGNILRPLIEIKKDEILKYLDENNLEYKIDKTNNENIYSRNFLRNKIIPEFFYINSNFKENINNTLNYFDELKTHLDKEITHFLDEKNYFDIDDFNNKSPFLQKEIIRYIYYISNCNSTIGLSEANILEILKFINGKNNKTIKEIKNLKMKKYGKKIYF